MIDVRKGHVLSEKPVWVKLTSGVINAKRLEMRDNGDVIHRKPSVEMRRQRGAQMAELRNKLDWSQNRASDQVREKQKHSR